ncbi:unnamed protein product [Cylicostephanus goldi]|uniref:Uncharacterized protein n=1 Tax=Cylicostephanus goldi TaxID=71465 RepID=A0A3P6QW95_CYLGO|nr:unnamed protein product [Cylicostephanus goldi]
MIDCDDLDPHPFAYRTFLMFLSAITPLINVYAVFCIVKKSTKQMALYKWWLLIYQLASSAFDFVYTTLLMPVMLFPTMMAYADSYIARWISLSTVTGIRIFAFSLVPLVSTIISLFIYRCYVVIPQNHVLKICLKGEFLCRKKSFSFCKKGLYYSFFTVHLI